MTIQRGRFEQVDYSSDNLNENEPVFFKVARPLIRLGNENMGKPDAFSKAISSGECESVVIPFVNDFDFALIAHGQSVVNEEDQNLSIPERSLVACKILKNSSHIAWGQVYALATTNGYVIKKVQRSSKEGYITCASFNKKGKFKHYDLSVNEIMEWALVIGTGSFREW